MTTKLEIIIFTISAAITYAVAVGLWRLANI